MGADKSATSINAHRHHPDDWLSVVERRDQEVTMLRHLAIGLSFLLGVASASAQEWPQRPVRLVVPYAAGGGTDIVARVLAQKLGDALGQRFVVENKTGASGMIGAQTVARADADGYTFLVATAAEIVLNQSLYKDMGY